MKKHTVLFFFLAVLLSASAVFGAGNKYNVNFKNVPMKDFITFVSEFTGKNVIFNEADIRGNVTVNSQKEMDEKEILDIFYSVMKMNGYIPVVSGDNIQIVPEKDVPTFDENIVVNGRGPAQSYVTSVITLDHYNAPTLLPILNRMKSRSGYVEAVRGLNIIVVKDQTSRINKMTALIRKLDTEANGYKFYSLPLKYAVASKVEQQIIKLYGEMGKNALTTTVPVVVSDDISNSLIIAATEKEYGRIKYLVENFDSKSTVENTAPKVFYLRNAKAEDVEKVLTKLVNSIAPAPQGGQAQAAGAVKANISSDKATNSIIAIGDQELYSNLATLIEKMDIPRRQVYVESLVLETSLDKTSSFGVDWYGGKDVGSGAVIGGLNNAAGLSGLVGAATGSGTASFPSGFSLGVIGDIILYNGMKFPSIGAFMSALSGVSGVSIVSNPQILTLDNEEAEVFVGENRPYLTSEKQDSNNNPIQTFDYRNVGIRLKITPQISSSDSIVLAIEQEVNKMAESSINTASPVTLNRTTKTVVKLPNKSVMVISGLIKNDTTVSDSGIPFLSKIPVLGWLFKSRSSQNEKTNLMVFISASIIDTVEDARALMKVREDSLNQFNKEADKALGSKIFDGMQNEINMLNTGKDNETVPAGGGKDGPAEPEAAPESGAAEEPDAAAPAEEVTAPGGGETDSPENAAVEPPSDEELPADEAGPDTGGGADTETPSQENGAAETGGSPDNVTEGEAR